MSIQGNVNQGINMASILYRFSPQYEAKEELRKETKYKQGQIKALKQKSEAIETSKGKAAAALPSITENLKDLPELTKANISQHEIDSIAMSRESVKKAGQMHLDRMSKLTDEVFNLRDSLLGIPLSGEEKKQISDIAESLSKKLGEYEKFKNEYNLKISELDEDWAKALMERDDRLEDERNNVEHITSASVGEGKKEEREVAPEMKAAESVIKAQQRSDLYKKRMETARENLRKQYEAGEFDAYELGRAMAFNGLVGGDR